MEIDFVYVFVLAVVCLFVGFLFAGQLYVAGSEKSFCVKEQSVGEWLAGGRNADPHALDSEQVILVVVKDSNI